MTAERKIVTESPEETLELASETARATGPGTTYALHGDLGTGKTLFARGFARGLGIGEDITSPTFNLMEVYQGRLTLYHFDLYRIEDPDELDNLFFEEYWEGEGVSLIEWAERAGNRLPDNTINVTLTYLDENRREIHFEYPGN